MGRARHRRRRWDFEVGVVKGLSPDRSTGRRRGVKGLRKNLLTQRPDQVGVKAR